MGSGSRLLYIDNIRIFLTFLVIIHHVAIAFGGAGDWILVHGATDEISPLFLTLLNGINQSFFMSFFFFVASYFIPRSLSRKGSSKFLRDRLKRLGIPLLVYLPIFGPLLSWWGWTISYRLDRVTTNAPTLSEYWIDTISTFAIRFGVLWFIYALLLLSVLYVVVDRLLFNTSGEQELQPDPVYPSNRTMVMWILIIGVVEFVLRIFIPVGEFIIGLQIGHFPQYLVLFFSGAKAYKENWLDAINPEQAKLWGRVVLIAIIIALVLIIVSGSTEPFNGGITWQSFVFAFWENTICMGMITYLLWLFKTKFNYQSDFVKLVSVNAYGAFLIQEFVIVGFTDLMFTVEIPSILEFVMVSILSIIGSFLVSQIVLRQIPYAKSILG